MRFFQATIDDVPSILPCAREFCAILDVPLDEAHYVSEWEQMISSGRGVIFLLEHEGEIAGGIGALHHRDLLTGQRVAVELFWYLKEKYRGGLWSVRLLKALEKWAAENDCQHVAMIHMEASIPAELKRFYEHRDYTHIESVYRKTLKVGVSHKEAVFLS